MNLLSNAIYREFFILKLNPDLKCFFKELQERGSTIIFGGACRDWLLGRQPKDIDLVTDFPLDFLDKYRGSKNSFGGHKIVIDGVKFDIWNLDSTWAFSHDSSLEKHVNNIINTSFFNLDAITFNIKTDEVQADRFISGFNNRLLDIIYEPNKYPLYVTSKALIMAYKYNLHLSDKLNKYIKDQMSLGYNEDNFKKYQIMNYKKEVYDYQNCIKVINGNTD